MAISFSNAGFACPFDTRIALLTKKAATRLLAVAILLHLRGVDDYDLVDHA